jgi:hypothetical protein
MPYNPYGLGFSSGGTYANHIANTGRGGEDYPLGLGTSLPAPSKGTLVTSGGSGEFATGWVGSAGLRSILMLDTPIGDVVAVVMQHQSRMGTPGPYEEGVTCGWSGRSMNGSLTAGQVHLHIHCLTASGERRQFTRYFAVGGGPAPDPGGGGVIQTPGNLWIDKATGKLHQIVRNGDDH